MPQTTDHAPLYEVRVPLTPELACSSDLEAVTFAEEKARARLFNELGPELLDRAKLWWELEEFHHDPTQPRPRWEPWQRGQMFPPHVHLLYCVMQVVQWWERNPLVYGFPDRRHDWPDFRCDEYCIAHFPPTHYCPICGDIFDSWDVYCGHSLEEGVPPPALVQRVPRMAE